MNNTRELPLISTHLDNTLALKFIPVVELQETFANFEQWKHSIRFYLRYHGLLHFIEGHQESQQESQLSDDEYRQRRCFVTTNMIRGSSGTFFKAAAILFGTLKLQDDEGPRL
ncbi:uncharacterized protein B0T23DRAFT_305769 [Neurospora hispaniola]|uniref:Uncharacterized protein n=1 Tax=Neurospora hispaniola TaxID=588809 RepID=A0AAJ0IH66_9PEZI|nr:hypothetical protein B0T23DRAFT_305769 [Neurospora hispaniola]